MKKLNLLLLEDDEFDIFLIKKVFEKSGLEFDITIVSAEEDFMKALQGNVFNVILSDNSLPQFNATNALKIVKNKKLNIPFILVTGTVSEEFAVEIMKEGASDYILKDRLQRLPSAVLNAINKHRLETEYQTKLNDIIKNEALMKEAERLAHFGSWEVDMISEKQYWSDENYRILGYEVGGVTPSFDNFLNRVHPDDLQYVQKTIDDLFEHLAYQKYFCRVITKNEALVKHIECEISITQDEHGEIIRFNGFTRDITERKHAESERTKMLEDIVQRNKDLEQFSYIVSHNLRAPVANLLGIAELMNNNTLTDREKKVLMEGLGESVKKLDNVIIDLNHITQVRHSINENREQVNFLNLVNNIIADINTLTKNNDVVIKTNFTEADTIYTVNNYMHSIFYNLITNTIKYKQPGVPLICEIKSLKLDNAIQLIFKDNGMGIDLKKSGDQVFQLYKRFHIGATDGKGMGLFMVKTHVESMGGTINVASEVNKGTEFKIEFPLLSADK